MTKLRIILALTFVAVASPAVACDPVVVVPAETRIDNYNSLTGGFYTEPLEIEVTNNNEPSEGSACVGRIQFSNTGTNTQLTGPTGDRLNFLIVDADNVSNVIFNPLNPVQSGISINVPPGKSRRVKAKLYVVGGQSAASGSYTNSITAQFVGRPNGPPGESSSPVSVALAASVLAVLQANFVGTDTLSGNGRNGGINLGEILPGMRRDLGMQLRSNAPVDVTVSSTNNGRLKRSATDQGIGYLILLNGNSLDLASANDLELPTAITPGGRTNPLSIQISNFVNAPAGDYGDVITFRITAR
jgi:hypothetical protein